MRLARWVSPIRRWPGSNFGAMRHLCMRPACKGPAVVLVVMDQSQLTFTVRDPAEIDGPGRVVLCETHLGRMRAPKGWTVVDERPGGDVVAFERRSSLPARQADLVGHLVDPSPEPEPRTIPDAVHPLRGGRPGRIVPTPTETPEPTRTPLLARAFLGVERHPAATIGSRSDDPMGDLADETADDLGDWDQRDPRDEFDDEPLPLDGLDPIEPDPA